jgi:MarR family 2-MHQ and catechol resistance regulon transcriptional repressor
VEITGIHLWLIIWRAYESLRAHAEHDIHSHGLGFSDFAVLEVLLHKGPTPINTIGGLVHLTSGSITAAVDRLAAKGLVERCAHRTDRRARVVSLTTAGRNLIAEAFAGHERAMEDAAAGLSPEERKAAARLLKKLGLSAKAAFQGRV